MAQKNYTLSEVANIIGGELHGDQNKVIHRVSPIASAQEDELTFLSDKKCRKFLATTKAAAVIISVADISAAKGDVIIVENPHLAVIKILRCMDNAPTLKPGIHPTALIGEHCQIAPSAAVGAYCVIGEGVKIGEGAQIGAGSHIHDHVSIGSQCMLHSNVNVYHRVRIGDRVIIHSGVVIGADGFGFAQDGQRWEKVPQIGGVIIGNDVEIGANTTIDRGALTDTIIGDGVKLDNLIQVAHNVEIGENSILAGCTGIAGSTKIGASCMIGGGSCINGHIDIADGTILVGMTAVGFSIDEPGLYASGLGAMPFSEWRRNAARFKDLEKMYKTLSKMEKLCESNDN